MEYFILQEWVFKLKIIMKYIWSPDTQYGYDDRTRKKRSDAPEQKSQSKYVSLLLTNCRLTWPTGFLSILWYPSLSPLVSNSELFPESGVSGAEYSSIFCCYFAERCFCGACCDVWIGSPFDLDIRSCISHTTRALPLAWLHSILRKAINKYVLLPVLLWARCINQNVGLEFSFVLWNFPIQFQFKMGAPWELVGI